MAFDISGASSSGIRFFLAITKTSISVSLFYTQMEVYIILWMVSGAGDGGVSKHHHTQGMKTDA